MALYKCIIIIIISCTVYMYLTGLLLSGEGEGHVLCTMDQELTAMMCGWLLLW